MHNTSETEKSDRHNGTGIRNRLLKGFGAQGFSQAVQIFIRLAEVPLLLGFWGTQLYGEWLMLAAIPSYLSIGDGGFAGAACREMTMRSGAGDRSGTLKVFQSTWVLLAIVSITICLMAIGFFCFIPITGWLGFSAMKNIEINTVLLLLVAHVLATFQGSLLNGGFWVVGCYPIGMNFITITQLLEFAGLAVAVASGWRSGSRPPSGYLAGTAFGDRTHVGRPTTGQAHGCGTACRMPRLVNCGGLPPRHSHPSPCPLAML
jgi:hypothetical protein